MCERAPEVQSQSPLLGAVPTAPVRARARSADPLPWAISTTMVLPHSGQYGCHNAGVTRVPAGVTRCTFVATCIPPTACLGCCALDGHPGFPVGLAPSSSMPPPLCPGLSRTRAGVSLRPPPHPLCCGPAQRHPRQRPRVVVPFAAEGGPVRRSCLRASSPAPPAFVVDGCSVSPGREAGLCEELLRPITTLCLTVHPISAQERVGPGRY